MAAAPIKEGTVCHLDNPVLGHPFQVWTFNSGHSDLDPILDSDFLSITALLLGFVFDLPLPIWIPRGHSLLLLHSEAITQVN